jgi:carbamoylphosphate synthase large subunit
MQKLFAENVGYPVLIRPSYVLSGAAMSIVLTKDELEMYLKKATDLNTEHPVVISKFITDAREIEVDAVASEGELFCYAIAEHVENAVFIPVMLQSCFLHSERILKRCVK